MQRRQRSGRQAVICNSVSIAEHDIGIDAARKQPFRSATGARPRNSSFRRRCGDAPPSVRAEDAWARAAPPLNELRPTTLFQTAQLAVHPAPGFPERGQLLRPILRQCDQRILPHDFEGRPFCTLENFSRHSQTACKTPISLSSTERICFICQTVRGSGGRYSIVSNIRNASLGFFPVTSLFQELNLTDTQRGQVVRVDLRIGQLLRAQRALSPICALHPFVA